MKRGLKNRFRPTLDPLDQRCLLAGSVTASLSGGVLTIRGTDAADVINVVVQDANSSYGRVSIDGVSGLFRTNKISAIEVMAGGGDDRVAFIDPGRWPGSTSAPRTRILGGFGNDALYGSSWDDAIYGEDGDDQLWGGRGSNTLDGGAGLDTRDGIAETSTTTTPTTTGDPTSPQSSTIEQRIIELTNLERQRQGLAPLGVNAKLVQAAQLHAGNMAASGTMSHTLTGSDLPTLQDRLNYIGYRYWAAGENIAYGYADADAVVAGWMGSAGHRANILSVDFTEIGVGVAYDGGGRPYYCQVFGRPA